MIGRSIGYPNSGALPEINCRRERMHVLFEHECVLCVCTAEGLCRVYSVAWFHSFDAFTDRLDDSSAIRPGSVGKRWLPGISARTHVGVIWIDPYRMNADQGLAGCRLRCRHILKFQNFRAA